MFNIFRSNDEFESKLIKPCPSCHGFIKRREITCRHCGNSTHQEQLAPLQFKESDDRSNFEANKFMWL